MRRVHQTYPKRWAAGGPEDVRFLALALAGEVGELCNEVKKEWRGDHDRDSERQLRELWRRVALEWADCRVYLDLLQWALGVDEDDVMEETLQKVYEKFNIPATERQ